MTKINGEFLDNADAIYPRSKCQQTGFSMLVYHNYHVFSLLHLLILLAMCFCRDSTQNTSRIAYMLSDKPALDSHTYESPNVQNKLSTTTTDEGFTFSHCEAYLTHNRKNDYIEEELYAEVRH